jgi:hypothetical protein
MKGNATIKNGMIPKYICTQHEITHEDFGTVKTYGIAVQFEREEERLVYADVSTDASKVQRLVELMNELQLDPIHLEDVIEDFLVDLE